MKKPTSALFLSFALLPGLSLAVGQISRISVDSAGGESNGSSYYPSISADGRYMAFMSAANNLVAGDTNETDDIFVRDRQTGQVTRVSVNSAGGESNGSSTHPSISADGRYVAFSSIAYNLADEDTNVAPDIFVHDRQTGQTTLVSVNSDVSEAYGASDYPSISADGRYVAFQSEGFNLNDIFVYDRQTGQTTRVSVNSAGVAGNSWSKYPAISADGRYVVFDSNADNLVELLDWWDMDTNEAVDVFVHDRQTGRTTRVSVGDAGEGNSDTFNGSISANGRYVTFSSSASNLVYGDTNETADVFVRDRQTGETTRVSVNSNGEEGNSYSYGAGISADGRFVTFASNAGNLVADDTNSTWDVFSYDRQTGNTSRISVDNAGLQGNSVSGSYAMSADGRYVAFGSWASNLVTGDTNGLMDIFARDRLLQTSKQTDVSLALSGPSRAIKGSDARYTFTVTNDGSINATSASLIGIISSRGKLKSIVPSQGTCGKSAVPVCRLGTLALGQSVSVTATVTVNGRTTVSATAQAAPKDDNPENSAKSITTTIQ